MRASGFAWWGLATGMVLAGLCGGVGGARILAFFIIPGRSHFIVTSSLARALAERGHELVVVSPFTTANPPPTYKDLTVTAHNQKAADIPDFYKLGNMPPVAMLLYMWGVGVEHCTKVFAEPKIKELVQSDQHFDLVLMEAFFSECFLGFAHKFNAPIVQLSAFAGAGWMSDWVGNPNPPSYVPDSFLDYNDKMTFCERVVNAALYVAEGVGRSLYYMPRMDAAMREGMGDPDMPHLADIERNTSLLLVNSHFSVGYPRPAVPAYVLVGGLHIKKPKPLPKELREWMDASPAEGFIYFSMGSNLRSADMPAHKRDAFLRAFAALPLRVLWKWEEDSLPGQPPNVRLSKWLPQQDVLAHPKLRLFITHGGLMSTQEAVYHGVPVVGIPIFGDQQLNMKRAELAGFGLALRFEDVTAESLGATLRRVLEEPTFRASAKHLSQLFHDRPRPPMDEAVYWTEYVLRHGGARHMRSAAVDLPWYQYLLLDVLLFCLLSAAFAALLFCLAARALLRCIKAPSATAAKKRD